MQHIRIDIYVHPLSVDEYSVARSTWLKQLTILLEHNSHIVARSSLINMVVPARSVTLVKSAIPLFNRLTLSASELNFLPLIFKIDLVA